MMGRRALLSAAVAAAGVAAVSAAPAYDVNADGVVNIADAVAITNVVTGGAESPECSDDGASVCYAEGITACEADCAARVFDHGTVNCRSAQEILQIGSSTVFPVADAHAQRYGNPLVAIEARESGSSLGFRAFFGGGTDVATASRALKGSDYESADCDPACVDENNVAICECQGRFPVGVQVGTDLLAVFTREGSTFATTPQTVSSLASAITSAQTGGSTTLCVPDPQSGTRDFAEEVLGVTFDGSSPNVNGFVDDAQIIACVQTAATNDVIGIAPISDVAPAVGSANSGMVIVPVDGVDPTAEPVNTAYPFLRPLFKYFDQADESNSFVREFICALLADESQAVVQKAGFVPLDETTRQASLATPSLRCPTTEGGAGVNLLNNAPLTGAFKEMSYCRQLAHAVMIGSSTVYPFARAIARLYPPTTVFAEARSTGSSNGLALLLAGAADIGDASRPLRGSDYEAFDCDPTLVNEADGTATGLCQGVLPKPFTVGFDLLSVIVSPDSPIAGQDVTVEQLNQIFQNGASFSSVFGVGSSEPPTLFVADTQSGTRGFWEDAVGPVMDGVNGFADDTVIANGVANDPNAIGFLGAAFVTPDVQALTVGGVDPTADGTDPASYDLSRPLFFYVNDAAGADRDVVDDITCFALSATGQEILARVGYVSVPSDQITSQRNDLNCIDAQAQ